MMAIIVQVGAIRSFIEPALADGLYRQYQEAAALDDATMRGSELMKVTRELGKLTVDDLQDLLDEHKETHRDFALLVGKKLTQKKKQAPVKVQVAGATEEEKAAARSKKLDEWALTCPTGLKVKFEKVASFAASFASLTAGFLPEETLLAFDMDGTLSWMSKYDGAATVQKLQESNMEKVVVTARNKDTTSCNTVLLTLTYGETGPQIEQLFGLPKECGGPVPVLSANGNPTGEMMITTQGMVMVMNEYSTQGIVMNEYSKAEGLTSYVVSHHSGGLGPKHVVFYDDYVNNLPNFAEHFCRHEKWAGLEQVTAVWFATPEAERRDSAIKERMKNGQVEADMHSEGSYFSPKASNDADLAGSRALFGVP